MVSVQRLTTEYIEAEDRIRLAGQLNGDAAVVLWLTRRLVQRLLPPLLTWLEGQRRALPRADILQSFAQQAARSEMRPQHPVQASMESTGWLVTSIEFASTEQAVRLTFKGDAQPAASVTMTATLLRQWLTILHTAYQKAGWPMELWPAWMMEVHPAAKPLPMVLH